METLARNWLRMIEQNKAVTEYQKRQEVTHFLKHPRKKIEGGREGGL